MQRNEHFLEIHMCENDPRLLNRTHQRFERTSISTKEASYCAFLAAASMQYTFKNN